MVAAELRSHLRIQTESRALLYLPDGSRIRCIVRDISMGGAYVVRSTEYGPPAPVAADTELRMYLFHPGSGDGFNLDATVVRAEAGDGGGLALRFAIYEETRAPLVHHLHREADRAGVKRTAMGVPILRKGQRNDVRALMFRRGVTAAAVIFGIWGLRIARDWLSAVL